MRNMIIIERVTLCRTLDKILKGLFRHEGRWHVYTTFGHYAHVIDGEIQYKAPPNCNIEAQSMLSDMGKRVLHNINKAINTYDFGRIVIATEYDMQGELLAEYLRVSLGLGDNYERCDICNRDGLSWYSRESVLKGLNNPRRIDLQLFSSDSKQFGT